MTWIGHRGRLNNAYSTSWLIILKVSNAANIWTLRKRTVSGSLTNTIRNPGKGALGKHQRLFGGRASLATRGNAKVSMLQVSDEPLITGVPTILTTHGATQLNTIKTAAHCAAMSYGATRTVMAFMKIWACTRLSSTGAIDPTGTIMWPRSIGDHTCREATLTDTSITQYTSALKTGSFPEWSFLKLTMALTTGASSECGLTADHWISVAAQRLAPDTVVATVPNTQMSFGDISSRKLECNTCRSKETAALLMTISVSSEFRCRRRTWLTPSRTILRRWSWTQGTKVSPSTSTRTWICKVFKRPQMPLHRQPRRTRLSKRMNTTSNDIWSSN